MRCVWVAPLLRRRIKLAAVSTGRPIQALAADALETLWRRREL
jgi:hypothetical protein